MAFNSFKQIRVPPDSTPTDKQINDLQANISTALQQLLGKDQLDSTVVQNITLQPAPFINKIGHNLGRSLTGYIVTRCHGGFPLIYDVQDTNPSPSILLYLMSATVITIDLLVY
jgi:hypothetical protein